MKKKILAVLLATGVAATTLLGGSILVSAADDGGNTAQARTFPCCSHGFGSCVLCIQGKRAAGAYAGRSGEIAGYRPILLSDVHHTSG